MRKSLSAMRIAGLTFLLSLCVVGTSLAATTALPVSQAVSLAQQHNIALKLAKLSYESAKIAYDKTVASNPTEYALLSANIAWEKAQTTYTQAKADVVISALSTYLSLQSANADLIIKEKQTAAAQRTLDRTKIYVQKGTANTLDELQAELAYMTASNAFDKAKDSYTEKLNAYAYMLGMEGTLPQISSENFLVLPEFKTTLDEAIQTVMKTNISIKEKEVALQQAQIQRTQDQLLELAPVDEQLSKNNLTLAELSLAKVRYDLKESVTASYNALVQSKKGLAIAQSAYDLENKRFEIVRKQYDAGLKTPSDLEAAEINLLKVRSDLNTAETGYVLAWLSFQKTLGNEIDLTGVVKPDATK